MRTINNLQSVISIRIIIGHLMIQSDLMSKTFRVELKTELPYWLLILPFLFLFGIITRPSSLSSWPLMVLIITLVSYSALIYRLNWIEIDTAKGVITLTKTNLLKMKRSQDFAFKDLQFTYKASKPGLYARLRNICRLYINKKEIAAIVPDYDGWTDDSVKDLAKCLVDLGVPKKFTGYSFKDAEINSL